MRWELFIASFLRRRPRYLRIFLRDTHLALEEVVLRQQCHCSMVAQ
jgi:hypothetical protein